MNRILFAASLVALVVTVAHAREPIHLANNPDLSPDGSIIAFDWNGDIWTVSSSGGTARQLTTHPARDSQPKFSPDGKRIAFISDRDGSAQVYVMPAVGGSPRQITFNTAGFALNGWTPDGKMVLVSSQRDNFWRHAERFFLVNVEKRVAEEMLFDDYGASGQLSPDGTKLLFTREGAPWWRKGYHGSQASQIWMYDLKDKSFRQLLNEPTGNLWPLWKPDGSGFYYVAGSRSVHELWEKDFSSTAGHQLTVYPEDDSIVYPCISHDGSTIVYRRQFDLCRYQPLSRGAGEQKIEIFCDVDRSAEKVERRSLTSANAVAFSGDGLEIAMIAGGDLWVMDTELREPKQVTATPEEERSPVFAPDGNSILFISDRDGHSEIYRATRADAAKYWWQNTQFNIERLTTDGEQKAALTFAPDGSHVAFVKGRGELCTMTPDGKTVKTILKSFSHPQYDWAPDGKWLVYSAEDEDFNRDVFIASIDGSRPPYNVSRHPRNDTDPIWSPDGKLIAFTGQRGEERDIFFVWLRADDDEANSRDRTVEKALEKMNKGRKPIPGPRSPIDGDGAAARGDDARPATTQPPAKKVSVAIDWDRLHERVHRVSIPSVTETNLIWSSDSRKLIFTGNVDSRQAMYYVELPDDNKPKLFATQIITQARLAAKNGQLVGLSSGVPFSLALDPTGKPKTAGEPTASTPAPAAPAAPGPRRARGAGAPTDAVSTGSDGGGYRFTALQEVDVSRHHAAVFDLAWRTMRDNYYDERLGNRDWNIVKKIYSGMAAEAPDAEALGTVINLMLGELNGSHLGWYGGIRDLSQRRNGPQVDEPTAGRWRETTAHFGARFDPDFHGPGMKIRDVVPGTPADHKKSRLFSGEIITHIDGKAVDPSMDLTTVLNGPAARDVTLKVIGTDGAARDVVLRPTTVTEVRRLLYDKWIKDNQTAIDKLSGGKLGYLHIAAMDETSFLKFEEQLYAAGAGKDGLVIDVRENGGGSTADHLLTALTQPVHAITIPRGGVPGYPQDRKVYATWSKPIVVLCNQNSFSNAEIFSHAVKTLKRGQLVGVPTAGGVISTGATTIMDAGLLRLPTRGWFVVGDGQDMELNGAAPEHVLWPQPGEMPAGKDLQLDKAVQVLLDDVKKWKAAPRPKPIKATERK